MRLIERTGRCKVWHNQPCHTDKTDLVFLQGALESTGAFYTGNLVSLSKQQIVHCVVTDSGCSACLMEYVFS